jgi:hypothetical protein
MGVFAGRTKFIAALLALSLAVLAGCAYIAESTAPKKQATSSRSDAAVKADALFWQTLHAGRYEAIPSVLQALTAASVSDPNDAVTAAHIGWMHIWRLAESAPLDRVRPTIVYDAVVARRYFQKAVDLDPGEARYLGFLASATMAEGSIHKDEELARRGDYLMLGAIKAWPEFNLFTAGYVVAGRPADSEQFKQGLEWEWQDLDVCVNEKVSRTNPDYAKYMALATTEGPKRACWNSWIAPHNFEGFFLNMGDMLVKSGDWQTAQKMYANAKLSPDYAEWKFRDVLEERIANAQRNVSVFNGSSATVTDRGRMMQASFFACMACHQQ